MKKTTKLSSMQSKLSIERTTLANHRTLLSYLRSSIGFVVAGAGLMKFIQDPAWVIIGIICVILAPITIILGIIDYVHVRQLIKKEIQLLSEQVDDTI